MCRAEYARRPRISSSPQAPPGPSHVRCSAWLAPPGPGWCYGILAAIVPSGIASVRSGSSAWAATRRATLVAQCAALCSAAGKKVKLSAVILVMYVLNIGTGFQLETCWWVPLLFGVAAVTLGLSHPLLDRTRMLEGFRILDFMFASSPVGGKAPSWLLVNAGIASFTGQYAMSGILEEASGGSNPSLGACLFLFAAAQWTMYDRTKGGLLMATLCAFAGPSLEIVLINVGGLYSYTHPDILGIPLWIPWVYFAGAPAVGNLGRRVFHIIERKYELSTKG
eukprot:SM000005S17266  [mRNA]  locus=s5:1156911:1158978:+ [translate_table: standard]